MKKIVILSVIVLISAFSQEAKSQSLTALSKATKNETYFATFGCFVSNNAQPTSTIRISGYDMEGSYSHGITNTPFSFAGSTDLSHGDDGIHLGDVDYTQDASLIHILSTSTITLTNPAGGVNWSGNILSIIATSSSSTPASVPAGSTITFSVPALTVAASDIDGTTSGPTITIQ